MKNLKKNRKAEIESKRMLFFEIGLVVTLIALILIFEWKGFEKVTIDLALANVTNVEEEMAPITVQNLPPPPPPPILQTSIMEILDNETEEEEPIEIDVEAGQDIEVQEFIPYAGEEEEEEEDVVRYYVEENAVFGNGDEDLIKYFARNIKYPRVAIETGIEGSVYVSFVIEKDGSLTNAKIIRGIGGGCDEEALRVLNNMPRWKPAKQNGLKVRQGFKIPIKFILH